VHPATKKLPNFRSKSRALLISVIIPLSLSAFTHIWNPIGFPTFHVDEGHYMRRAMQVLEGLGPQETNDTYEYGYDHPYFGQIFLASSLSLINYPGSLNPTVNLHSIEMLYLVPRVLMGLLAVFDTFLVYKIGETRYNRKVAFISASLFAVMPLSRILRAILLDSIELPFILLSILFAVFYSKLSQNSNSTYTHEKKVILLLLSGLFLGVAIFTKVPVFTMIPLVCFIILRNVKSGEIDKFKTKNRLRTLAIWLIPVVLIPSLWPAYAISMGQFGQWVDGVLYQTARQGGRDLLYSFTLVGQIDPLLIILGFAGIIYAAVKKDLLVILWTVPYLIFLYLIGWVVYFHWSVLLPVLCIGAGILVEGLRGRLASHKFISLLPYVMVSAVAIFGFLNIASLTLSDLNKSYTEVYLFVTKELEHNKVSVSDQNDDSGTTLIGSHRTRAFLWMTKYVFHDNITFRDTDLPHDNFTNPLHTKKYIIVADSNLLARLTEVKQFPKYALISKLYYDPSQTIATFIDETSNKDNFFNLRENYGFGPFVEVRANY
jgi:hypothetical protein